MYSIGNNKVKQTNMGQEFVLYGSLDRFTTTRESLLTIIKVKYIIF